MDDVPIREYPIRKDGAVLRPRTMLLFWGSLAVIMSVVGSICTLCLQVFTGGALEGFSILFIGVAGAAFVVCSVGLSLEFLSWLSVSRGGDELPIFKPPGFACRVNDDALQILKHGRVAREIAYGDILSCVRTRQKHGDGVHVTVIDGTWATIGPLDKAPARTLIEEVHTRVAKAGPTSHDSDDGSAACSVGTARCFAWLGSLVMLPSACFMLVVLFIFKERGWEWWFLIVWWACLLWIPVVGLLGILGFRYRIREGAVVISRWGRVVRRVPLREVNTIVVEGHGLWLFLTRDVIPIHVRGLLRNQRAALCRAIVAQRGADGAVPSDSAAAAATRT